MLRTAVIAFSLIWAVASIATAAEWPHLRGPQLDGRVAEHAASAGDSLALEVAWKAPLGPAYSGVTAARGRLITMYSDGTQDLVVALDAKDGHELWRYPLGPTYRGHDGSEDGPLSTPTIGHQRVYALAPGGLMVALGLDDGKPVWRADLTEMGATEPFYGFASTPAIAGDAVLVQTGGAEGPALVALAAGTGKSLWSAGKGEERAGYGSPVVMELAGRSQVVNASGHQVLGVAADTGEVLWEHTFGTDDSISSTLPTSLGDDSFLVMAGGKAVALRVAQAADDSLQITELYRTNALGRGYPAPVVHDGYIYGYHGKFLSCLKVADGKRVWRSRPPGGRGLMLLGDHLVLYGAEGNIVIADASPEGYVERARNQALERSGYAWPIFASERIVVRNGAELAALTIATRPDTPAVASSAAGSPSPATHGFGRWVQKLQAADAAERSRLIEELVARPEGLPIVEGNLVHFVYHGPTEDLALGGSMADYDATAPMQRVDGTDLYYATHEMAPGSRWEYRFLVDFDKELADPRNPHTVPAIRGDDAISEVATAGYTRPSHIAEPGPDGPRGTFESITVKSAALEGDRSVAMYLPPGYAAGGNRYPLLVVNEGPAWRDKGLLANTLDNLIGKSIEPLVVALVEPSRRWWGEAGGGVTDAYATFLAEELVPHLTEKYSLRSDRQSRAVMGTRGYGFTAVYTALRHPEV